MAPLGSELKKRDRETGSHVLKKEVDAKGGER